MPKKLCVRLILIPAVTPLLFFEGCKEDRSRSSQNSQAVNDRRIVSQGSSGDNDRRSAAKRVLAEIRENEDYSMKYIEESSINECENLLLAIFYDKASDRESEILDILLMRMAKLDPSLTMDLIAVQPEIKIRKECLGIFFSKLTDIDPLKEMDLSRHAQTREDANFRKSTLMSSLPSLPISTLVDVLDDSSLSEVEAALLHSSIGVRAGYDDLSYEEVSKLDIDGEENELIENWAIIRKPVLGKRYIPHYGPLLPTDHLIFVTIQDPCARDSPRAAGATSNLRRVSRIGRSCLRELEITLRMSQKAFPCFALRNVPLIFSRTFIMRTSRSAWLLS